MKQGIGALLLLVIVVALGVMRFQARQARYERVEQEFAQRDTDFRQGAHDLVSQAKDAKVALYLNTAVDEFHDDAFDQESTRGLLYRNALFDLISAKAQKSGRED